MYYYYGTLVEVEVELMISLMLGHLLIPQIKWLLAASTQLDTRLLHLKYIQDYKYYFAVYLVFDIKHVEKMVIRHDFWEGKKRFSILLFARF